MKRAWIALLSAAACVAACAEPAPEPASEPEEPSTSAARWEPVRRPSDQAVLEQPAQVVAGAAASGEVSAPFRARVVSVHVAPGAHVEAGDPILDVVMGEVLDAAAKVRGLSGRITAHRGRLEELERLRAEQLVDANRVFEHRVALAELEAERAQALAVLRAASLDAGDAARVLRQGAIPLRAPNDGVVRTLDAHLGETREPGGAPFARVVGVADARIEVRSAEPLPSSAAMTFESASGARLPLAAAPIAQVVDPADGTYVTWLAPAEPVPLADGLRGRIRIALEGDDLWEVPASALTMEGDATWLTIRRGDAVERVKAEVRASSGATAVVRAPLAEGDRVASDPSALTEAP